MKAQWAGPIKWHIWGWNPDHWICHCTASYFVVRCSKFWQHRQCLITIFFNFDLLTRPFSFMKTQYRDKFCIMIKCKIKEMHNPNWFLFWLPQMSEWQIRETRTPKQGIFTSLVQWRTEKRYCSMVSSSLFSPKTSLLTITFQILELLPVCSCVYFKPSREIKKIREKKKEGWEICQAGGDSNGGGAGSMLGAWSSTYHGSPPAHQPHLR